MTIIVLGLLSPAGLRAHATKGSQPLPKERLWHRHEGVATLTYCTFPGPFRQPTEKRAQAPET